MLAEITGLPLMAPTIVPLGQQLLSVVSYRDWDFTERTIAVYYGGPGPI
jgi:hypothetical protein